MSNYKFCCLVFLVKIDPTNFDGRNYLVSAVQHRGTRKKYGSTPNATVSAHKAK